MPILSILGVQVPGLFAQRAGEMAGIHGLGLLILSLPLLLIVRFTGIVHLWRIVTPRARLPCCPTRLLAI
jgi:hypothetical protein